MEGSGDKAGGQREAKERAAETSNDSEGRRRERDGVQWCPRSLFAFMSCPLNCFLHFTIEAELGQVRYLFQVMH